MVCGFYAMIVATRVESHSQQTYLISHEASQTSHSLHMPAQPVIAYLARKDGKNVTNTVEWALGDSYHYELTVRLTAARARWMLANR
jgi:hypothetical protein